MNAASHTFDVPALLEESIEHAAERTDDITALVYQHFFARRPEARAYFTLSEIDPRAKGRMLAEVLDLILCQARGESYVAPWLECIAADHQSYGVMDRSLYFDFLHAIHAALRETAAEAWTPDMSRAWDAQLSAFAAAIPDICVGHSAG